MSKCKELLEKLNKALFEGKEFNLLIHKYIISPNLPEANFLKKVVHVEILKRELDNKFLKKNRITRMGLVDVNLDNYLKSEGMDLEKAKKDILKEYKKSISKLGGKVTLYRGSDSKEVDTISSWTDNYQKALFFAGFAKDKVTEKIFDSKDILTSYQTNVELKKAKQNEYLVIS